MPDTSKYTIVFADQIPMVCGLRPLVNITQYSLGCNVVRDLKDVPLDSRPILFAANVPFIRRTWGNVRDDAIIYETEQHSWWLPQDYIDWLKNYTVWSVFKNVIQDSIYVPPGYSDLFKPSHENKWIDVLHYGSSTPHRSSVIQEISRTGLKIMHVGNIYDDTLNYLIGCSKCVVSINIGGPGDGARFAVVRCMVPMSRGVPVLAETTQDIHDCGWAPTNSDETNLPKLAQSIVDNYEDYGERDYELIKKYPFSETVRIALLLSI